MVSSVTEAKRNESSKEQDNVIQGKRSCEGKAEERS